MNKITTALFDFDGVIADTESQYDIFWGGMAEKYRLGIPNFPARIKGTTLQHIHATYFSDLTTEEWDKVIMACADFEYNMDFQEIPGSVALLHLLKGKGYQLGLVTSSPSSKMENALKKMNIEAIFNTIVTSDRITRGKPDPMCYLLAAEDLQAKPEACVVFEDAFTGIQAGTTAGMRVIGLATTNPADALHDKVYSVISDFKDREKVLGLL